MPVVVVLAAAAAAAGGAVLVADGRAVDRQAAARVAAQEREVAFLAAARAEPRFGGDELVRTGRPRDFGDAELLGFGRAACTSYSAGRTVGDLAHAYGYFTVAGTGHGLSNPYLGELARAALLLCPDANPDVNPRLQPWPRWPSQARRERP